MYLILKLQISRDGDSVTVMKLEHTQKNTQPTSSISRYSECKHASILTDVLSV